MPGKTQTIRLIRLWMRNEVLSMPNDSVRRLRRGRISGNSGSDFPPARRNSSRKSRGNRKLLGAINMERGGGRRRQEHLPFLCLSLSLMRVFYSKNPLLSQSDPEKGKLAFSVLTSLGKTRQNGRCHCASTIELRHLVSAIYCTTLPLSFLFFWPCRDHDCVCAFTAPLLIVIIVTM